ncbi:MAG: YceI family protein [FCB group bacterium]|nr:YceI family protein [FCB group bacterium]MBL7027372.1 YceI family protein [Candidatus Neomarinimicrobiota bacterium]MBL7122677.1 YceI family protein [Candidatus Neomarinimicrobiota bacterium]
MNKSVQNIAVATTTFFLALSVFAGTPIDVKKSSVEWVGNKVTGSHNGSLEIQKGEVTIEKGEIRSGRFILDMTSIKVLDIKDEKWNKKLEKHLKDDDFFGVNNYPKAVFEFALATPIKGAKDDEPNYHFKGDLILKGITHALDFDARVDVKKKSASASGQIIVDRTKYNIRYKSNKFFDGLGDKAIYDEFSIIFNVLTK